MLSIKSHHIPDQFYNKNAGQPLQLSLLQESYSGDTPKTPPTHVTQSAKLRELVSQSCGSQSEWMEHCY